MSKKPVDDGLAADAALAVEHTPEREAEQRAWFGGDVDDIDDFDATGLDDGSDPDFVAPDPKDEDKDDADDDAEDADADAEDADADAEDDSADDGEDSKDDDADDSDGDEDSSEEADDADADADSGDADEDDEPAPAPKGIPKHRFDEVNEKRKTAEAENARLKAELEAGKPPEKEEEAFDFDAAEKEYVELTLDGDIDAALAKRKEIRAAEHASWKAETKSETKSDISQDAESQELLTMSHEAEEMFDVFNPDHEDYNQGMLNKVLVFMRGYEANGDMTRADAFVAGLADVVEMYDLMPPEDEANADDGKPKPTGKKKVDKTKAKLKDKAHHPAGLDGQASADVGAAVPDIDNMTDEELDALPDKALARMRGDFV